MEESRNLHLGTKTVFILSTFEKGKHPDQSHCFDRGFDYPRVSLVTFVPRKRAKSHKLST